MNKTDWVFGVAFFALIFCFIGLGVGDSLQVCEYNQNYIQEISKLILAISGGYLAHRTYKNIQKKDE